MIKGAIYKTAVQCGIKRKPTMQTATIPTTVEKDSSDMTAE